MNDRKRRVMRMMKREHPSKYKLTVVQEIIRGVHASAKAIFNQLAKFLRQTKRKPIKWHKSNKKWGRK